ETPRDTIDLEPLRRILAEHFHPESHQEAQELILQACQEAQHLYGYVPEAAAEVIADHLGTTVNRIFGLLTFYADFRTEPPGKHFMLLCHGAACYVMGSQRLIESLATRYRLDEAGTTEDGELTVQVVNGCLGVCDLAPVVQVDHKTYCGRLDPDRLDRVIEALKRGQPLEVGDEAE
ncbi:MAG: NAD(P)H-dependent oxidoreductase subunit E, partial [Thermomicrobiaceae bacterium]|nr:NAD(P)H-dependent oxidoreductase subunit E [Thermomicrobiaceae bacterium]